MKKTISAGGVVVNEKGEILIVSQRGNSWSLPKGHVERDEDILAAAKREIYEESGVNDLKYIKKLGYFERYRINDPSELKEIHIFHFVTSQIELKPVDVHNPEAIWVGKDKVTQYLTSPIDKEFFESIKAQI